MSENIIEVTGDYELKWAKCPNCDKDHLYMLVNNSEPPRVIVFGGLWEDVDDEDGETTYSFEFRSDVGAAHVVVSETREAAVALAENMARRGAIVGSLVETVRVPSAAPNRGMH